MESNPWKLLLAILKRPAPPVLEGQLELPDVNVDIAEKEKD